MITKLWQLQETEFIKENIEQNGSRFLIGNGYMGANVFGRTDVERIQITENSLCNPGKGGGLNNFAEVMIRLGHTKVENYVRELILDDGMARVR